MRPVNKYIIIEKIEEELVNKEGLILSKDDEIHYRYKKARVLGVGENVSEISSGDYIYYDQLYAFCVSYKFRHSEVQGLLPVHSLLTARCTGCESCAYYSD
jgi:co-chaperonin GroES (HSP10)